MVVVALDNHLILVVVMVVMGLRSRQWRPTDVNMFVISFDDDRVVMAAAALWS